MIYFEIFWVFFKISLISFGGVFGVLPELERMIVQEHQWMTSEKFFNSYVIAQFVPGPNMAMCPLIGFWVAGAMGFFAGFVGIYLGPIFVMGGIERFFESRKGLMWVKRFEQGLRPLVLGLTFSSALRFWWLQSQGASTFEMRQKVVYLLASLGLSALGIYFYSTKKLGPMALIFLSGAIWWAIRLTMA